MPEPSIQVNTLERQLADLRSETRASIAGLSNKIDQLSGILTQIAMQSARIDSMEKSLECVWKEHRDLAGKFSQLKENHDKCPVSNLKNEIALHRWIFGTSLGAALTGFIAWLMHHALKTP